MTTTKNKAKRVWDAVLGELQLQVTKPSYDTWLKDTQGSSFQDGEFVVITPNTFVSEMLERRMRPLIAQALSRIINASTAVRFEVAQEPNLGSLKIPLDRPTGPPNHRRTSEGKGLTHRSTRSHLNTRYTFETFIVGKSNELAHAAAMAVSKAPGSVYNPLVMYSDVGLGKTHLLHAIGHAVRSLGHTLIYTTTEEFTNEYITAIREGKTEGFRSRYRSADMLLLDDIQFLMGKEQTQEGFFHTFNSLHMANRQIVITTDRPVTALSLLEARVRSRLSGGLVVDIQRPDLETRIAILRAKANLLSCDIPDDALDYLARRSHRNIRELEGNLNRVAAFSQLRESAITMDFVRVMLASEEEPAPRHFPNDSVVLEKVIQHYGTNIETLRSRNRTRGIAEARQVAMYLLREDSGMSLAAIGKVLGKRDHSTILYGCERMVARLESEDRLRHTVLAIRRALLPS